MAVYGRLIVYLKPYRREIFLAYSSVIISIGLSLVVPQVIKRAIDTGLAGGTMRAIVAAAAAILLLALIRAFTEFGVRYFGEWLSHRFAYDIRNDFYNKVQGLPFSFHDRAHTGDLMSRAIGDISESERFIGVGLIDLVSTAILLVGVIAAMLVENSTLALLALTPMPVLLWATIRFGGTVRGKFKGIQEQMGVLSTTMQESLTGIRVVKAFAREPHELQKFDRENEGWFARRYDVIQTWANNWPFFTFLLAVSIFLLLWFGGPQAIEGRVTIGSLFAMITYVMMLNGPVQRLGFLVNLAATSGASGSRVFYIMDQPNEELDQPGAVPLGDIEGEVRFENLSFAYQEGRNTLVDIDFQVPAGGTIALIGPTGSGKSTITNLIPRFYNPTRGRILVDGHDISQVQVASLRRHIGIVLQDPFLFSSSIAENIAYGRPGASREDIIAAATAAHAHEFITSFPKGYDTIVGERGVTLSGGQKQRVAIARALLYDPRILILDDSTSSVDTETEHLIQQALEVLMQGRTTFIIAQRLLTLKSADMILVLDRGRIVQRGTHDDLIAIEGLYKQIYDLQLRDQEEFMAVQANYIP
ncbi:MAG: ABC transporter ATP-binding protein/permease [Anaerolineae bacterium]|nr:ABC transporter ATP-binding protein/permease [Anaerolineae bacterium]